MPIYRITALDELIFEINESWLKPACTALNWLNVYRFDNGVYGADCNDLPRCDPKKLALDFHEKRLFGFAALHNGQLVGIATYSIPIHALDNVPYPVVTNL